MGHCGNAEPLGTVPFRGVCPREGQGEGLTRSSALLSGHLHLVVVTSTSEWSPEPLGGHLQL